MTEPLILGIESSGPRSAVALVRGDNLLFETAREGTNHNEVLLEMLDELFFETGSTLDEVSGIGVTTGPGMFTVLRVGIATATGLALPRRIPLKAVGTLPAIAETCRPARNVIALVDARRNQVYCGVYQSGRVLVPPQAVDLDRLAELIGRELSATTTPQDLTADSPQALTEDCRNRQFMLAGSGVEVVNAKTPNPATAGHEKDRPNADRFPGLDIIDSGIRHPSAFAVAGLARVGLDRDGPDPAEALVPSYLRRTDAEINREAKLNRPG